MCMFLIDCSWKRIMHAPRVTICNSLNVSVTIMNRKHQQNKNCEFEKYRFLIHSFMNQGSWRESSTCSLTFNIKHFTGIHNICWDSDLYGSGSHPPMAHHGRLKLGLIMNYYLSPSGDSHPEDAYACALSTFYLEVKSGPYLSVELLYMDLNWLIFSLKSPEGLPPKGEWWCDPSPRYYLPGLCAYGWTQVTLSLSTRS